MQDAVGLFGVGGEAGEEEACLAVAVHQTALPGEGPPTAKLPAEARQTVGVAVDGLGSPVDQVVLDESCMGQYVRAVVALQRQDDAQLLLRDGVQYGDKRSHAVVVDRLLYLLPIHLPLQCPAGEGPVGEVAKGDAAGGKMARHVTQQEEDLESG